MSSLDCSALRVAICNCGSLARIVSESFSNDGSGDKPHCFTCSAAHTKNPAKNCSPLTPTVCSNAWLSSRPCLYFSSNFGTHSAPHLLCRYSTIQQPCAYANGRSCGDSGRTNAHLILSSANNFPVANERANNWHVSKVRGLVSMLTASASVSQCGILFCV